MDIIDELQYLRGERIRLNKGLMTSVKVFVWSSIIVIVAWVYHVGQLKEEHARQLNQAKREPREVPTMREIEILRDNQYLYQGK